MPNASNVSFYDPFCEYVQALYLNLKWLPDERSEKIKSIALGVIVGLASFFLAAGVMYLLKKYVSGFSISQDTAKIYHIFKNVHPLLDLFWKAVWRGYVVLGGPILEEFIFRGLLFEGIKKCQGEQESLIKRIIRIAIVSIVFGLCHLSPFQNGLSNLVIFGLTTVIGVVLTVLKEWRKDLISPVTAHVIYNLGATL